MKVVIYHHNNGNIYMRDYMDNEQYEEQKNVDYIQIARGFKNAAECIKYKENVMNMFTGNKLTCDLDWLSKYKLETINDKVYDAGFVF